MIKSVTYAPASAPSFQTSLTSILDFEGTLLRLKQAIGEKDLWLIQEINPQMLLERGGYAIAPARQLLFFHPRYAASLLAGDPSALAEIPLKFIVMQMPDNSVAVKFNKVESLLGRYPALAGLTTDLAEIVEGIAGSVAA